MYYLVEMRTNVSFGIRELPRYNQYRIVRTPFFYGLKAIPK